MQIANEQDWNASLAIPNTYKTIWRMVKIFVRFMVDATPSQYSQQPGARHIHFIAAGFAVLYILRVNATSCRVLKRGRHRVSLSLQP